MIEFITTVKDYEIRKKAIERFRERGILLPTFAQMRNPEKIPAEIHESLKNIGLWDLHPHNLFRITWKNEPVEKGGDFGKVNYIELPSSITGVKAKIVLIVGKWFPTGAHKVGAAYGCLAPRIITGQFDPTKHKAVWPSTGNYCRGGAFDSYLMGCQSVAILPEEMSRERFEWLREIGAEIFATPGCESNVKEIYDKCWELRRTQPDYVILNQFDEFGNPIWHYHVTGPALEETYNYIKTNKTNLAAYISNTGSAGTIAAGDYLKMIFPTMKIVAAEALQCPTLLNNGFGGHRIEGIGDKHIPWVHNVKNTDLVSAIDDEDCIRIMRLFNDPEGKKLLIENNVDKECINNLHLLGISGIANLLAAIKTAKYFEMTENDVILSLATDSMDLYESRIDEENQKKGVYNTMQAAKDFDRCLLGQNINHLKELNYYDKKAIHNLKYFTWVEQQQKDVKDLNQLWEDKELWPSIFKQVEKWDIMIEEFNSEVLKK